MTRVLVIGLSVLFLSLPLVASAQMPQNKEPMLLQLYEDTTRARQNAEVELASCKVQMKEIQQQLQVATEKAEKKDVKEKK